MRSSACARLSRQGRARGHPFPVTKDALVGAGLGSNEALTLFLTRLPSRSPTRQITICGTGSPNLPALPRRPQTPIEQGALCSPHRDAKLSHPSSIRLRDFHPPHRLWFIGPVQQLLPNGQPVLLEIVAELIDRHPVDARATFVAPHLPQRLLQVCSYTERLHDSTRVGWAFGLTHRRRRFDVFPSRLPGFTRRRRWEVQSDLSVQPFFSF